MKLAYLATVAVLATTATSTAAPADIAANATEVASSRQLLGNAGYLWFRMRGVDIVGKDTTQLHNVTFDDCTAKCYLEPASVIKTCTALSWVPYDSSFYGTCYFKAAEWKNTPTTPKSGVESYVFINEHVFGQLEIVSATAVGFDMPGNDLTTTDRDDMSKCRNDCAANKECYAVVWTDYNRGTCWLKRRASTLVPKAGALSAYLSRGH